MQLFWTGSRPFTHWGKTQHRYPDSSHQKNIFQAGDRETSTRDGLRRTYLDDAPNSSPAERESHHNRKPECIILASHLGHLRMGQSHRVLPHAVVSKFQHWLTRLDEFYARRTRARRNACTAIKRDTRPRVVANRVWGSDERGGGLASAYKSGFNAPIVFCSSMSCPQCYFEIDSYTSGSTVIVCIVPRFIRLKRRRRWVCSAYQLFSGSSKSATTTPDLRMCTAPDLWE
ncbi:hypothetical protein FN846DRAFT_724221 [Sphaerosporella brunnea]|uniref:Uncharacterized protein n=1 Tax=Sphaerosporella brunnea TaxID=1250544 RepID=A0A5J5EWF8_9PEZI|nr:hypothetical protein FN846DRAFT_724221 [Sphaerosporella brunnea]